MRSLRWRAAAVALMAMPPLAPAHAACPIELAVYSEPDIGASLNFAPVGPGVASNAFRLGLESDGLLDAVVLWSDDPGRPIARIMHQCPEGDATGEEIAACTIWQGVVYTVDAAGAVGLLPFEGEAAPPTLLLPDFARALGASGLKVASHPKGLPWEAFSLTGCQE